MNRYEKLEKLKSILSDAGSAVVALSGGTDSTFLVSVARGVRGLRLMAVTVSTPYMFSSEVDDAVRFCLGHEVKHREIKMDIPSAVLLNPHDRCYLCKTEVMKAITAAAREGGFEFVLDGTNADDLREYRPGLRALREAGVRSPLAEAMLTKEEIRALSREAGIEVSDKPSNTCLLTRFPHDTQITPAGLRLAEKAERIVSEAGFPGARVRVHGELVRIEVRDDQFDRITLPGVRMKLSGAIKTLGFRYVSIDTEGYRTGSMNKKEEE
ncbi:MAG TPA: ATP-dependent sacrificial sulfur transferase LarE [Bacteroidales bacterium]|nr:ATP-dependent sacrificial sulfur transferase LarE [Bacteroidales bacterium]